MLGPAAPAAAVSLQSCLTLCDPMDCSLPGSSILGIFQATVLEWGAIAFSVRSRNQGKLEVVKQEMARVNVDIVGISELKWTGMGEYSSYDHYILMVSFMLITLEH